MRSARLFLAAVVALSGCSGNATPLAPGSDTSAGNAASAEARTPAEARASNTVSTPQSAIALVTRNAFPAGAAGRRPGLRTTTVANAAALRAAGAKGLLFIGDYGGGVVDVFPLTRQGAPLAKISTGVPVALATDATGNLYVALGGSTVSVYQAGTYQNTATLTCSCSSTFGVAVAKNGDVAVADLGSYPSPGTLAFFHAGETAPYNAIDVPAQFSYPEFVAYDGAGNLYLAAFDATLHWQIGEVVGGGSGSTITPLSLSPSVVTGMQVDGSGNLALLDYASINVYAPASNTLVTTVPLAGQPNARSFAFEASGTRAYVGADDANYDARAEVFAYPKGGKPLHGFAVPVTGSVSYAGAMAISPRLAP